MLCPYSSSGLPAGTYFARTFNSLGFVDQLYNGITCISCFPVTTGTPISVTVGSTTGNINFALAVGGRISGTVTNATTATRPANAFEQNYNSSGSLLTSFSTA